MRESRRPRIILGILLLVAFSFVAIDLRADANGPLGSVKRVTGAVLGPLESVTSSITSPIRGFFTGLTGSGDRDAQMSSLEAEVARLRAAGASPDTERRLAELDDLLRMSRTGQYRVKPAQVIAMGASQGFSRTVTIDVGQRDGIAVDMTVLARGGLLGRVVSVSTSSSVVVLLIDSTTSVGGRLEGAGEIGFVGGTGSEDQLDFQLLDPYGPLKKGDRLVTFGSKSGRPYVPGVPIGEVTEVTGTPGQLTRLAKVRPYVNVSTVDLVAVVVEPPRENPRDAVLVPTEPGGSTPTVTVTVTATPGSSPGSVLVPPAQPTDAPSPSVSSSPTQSTPEPTVKPTPEPTSTGDGASPAGP